MTVDSTGMKGLTLGTAIAFLAVSVAAQSTPQRTPLKKKEPVATDPLQPIVIQPAGLVAPLSPDIERLPPGYPGDSIESVSRILKSAPKSEFETSDQYAARLNRIRSNRTYSFWLDRPIARTYDADKQILRIE